MWVCICVGMMVCGWMGGWVRWVGEKLSRMLPVCQLHWLDREFKNSVAVSVAALRTSLLLVL
jgi:hypothetical protein